MDLVLFDTINKEVSWVQPNDRSLVAADFDGEDYSPKLLVDDADELGEVAVLHHDGEAAAVDLVVHALDVLGDPGLLFVSVAVFVLARTHDQVADEGDDAGGEAALREQGHLDLFDDDELVQVGRPVLADRRDVMLLRV